MKTEAKGKVNIPDLSEETYADLEMTVACDEETGDKRALKEAMRTTGQKKIREACAVWVAELKKNVYNGDASAMVAKKPAAERVNNQYVVSGSESKKVGSIKISYNFTPPPHVMYETLLDTDRIRGATASDASMSKEVRPRGARPYVTPRSVLHGRPT